jgi:hypothetical protein
MSEPFLSDAWIDEVRAIRDKYADDVPEVTAVIRINQVITETPFGDGEVRSYIDTSSGAMVMELGELDEPDATIMTDYSTARALFVEQDQAVVMQAFLAGKITVQGDMMKLMAMQTAIPDNETTAIVAAEILAVTE